MNRITAPMAGLMASLAGAAVADPHDCEATVSPSVQAEIEAAIGLPIYHNDVVVPQDLDVICQDRFCAQFSEPARGPIWVVERLTPAIVTGDHKRPKSEKWRHDANIDPSIDTVKDEEYKNSGYSRGHMAASSDFKCSEAWMRQTFRFSNAVPQVQNGFNGAIWSTLENRVKKLATLRDEIYVITGPVPLRPDGAETVISRARNGCGQDVILAGLSKLGKRELCNASDKTPSAACLKGIDVPSGLFKIVFDPSNDRRFGFVLSNEDHTPFRGGETSDEYLERWRVSLDVIEELTSLEFFPAFNARANRVAGNNCTVTTWR